MCKNSECISWVLQNLLDKAVKDERRKRKETKDAIIRYNKNKDNWNPLIKYLWRITYPGTFETNDIEKSRASIEIFQKYTIFDKEGLDENLMWGNLQLTADVMTSAGILITKIMGINVEDLAVECVRSKWSEQSMDSYINRLGSETRESFLVFLSLVYTPGNLIVVGKNKSNQENDQWDYVMTHLEKYVGTYNDIPNASSLAGRGNNCVFAPFGKSYINDLYLQDYNREQVLNEQDWKKTFDDYSRLIIKRGIRIKNAIDKNSSMDINDDIVDSIIADLKEKYK